MNSKHKTCSFSLQVPLFVRKMLPVAAARVPSQKPHTVRNEIILFRKSCGSEMPIYGYFCQLVTNTILVIVSIILTFSDSNFGYNNSPSSQRPGKWPHLFVMEIHYTGFFAYIDFSGADFTCAHF